VLPLRREKSAPSNRKFAQLLIGEVSQWPGREASRNEKKKKRNMAGKEKRKKKKKTRIRPQRGRCYFFQRLA